MDNEAIHDWWTVFSDGGARGNPGPAAGAAVLLDPAGNLRESRGKYLGHNTNNIAEYEGLILGLEMALKAGASHVHAYTDSQLVARQVEGIYRARRPELQALLSRVQLLRGRFAVVTFAHVPRRENFHADRVVNETLDQFLISNK
jgi:ribonuclease HI